MDLAAREQLRSEQYLEVLRLSFPDTNHHCRFFWRPLDHRARILVSRRDGQGRTAHYCCPLTALKLIRQASRLLLNRYDPYDRQYAIWANLRFPTYEHQALFYCAFVALKRQDREPSPPRLDDYFPGEAVVFSGEIEDDSYLHWLRVLRDADTDAVRLEASPRRGPMVGVPIWTAFVGEYVGARRWLRRISNNVIELESLRPYVFCHSYRPPRVQGRFRLNFTTREDAENFKHQFQLL
ncbi:MAG: hypothetical protein INR71_01290 [Terriglobus roseus]|nr:hypothetical protein [Terriglobus roseus]